MIRAGPHKFAAAARPVILQLAPWQPSGSCARVSSSGASGKFSQRLAGLLDKPSLRWCEALWSRGSGQFGDLLRGEESAAEVRPGLTLAWEVVGPGVGRPTVVATPSGQLPRDGVRALATALACGAGARVLIWDRRCTGASSPWADVPTSMPEEEAQDLVALLDHLRVTAPVLLVGSSAGARLSALVVAQCPERVAALALVPPTGDAGGAAPRLADGYYGDYADAAEQGGMQAVMGEGRHHFSELARRRPAARGSLLAVDAPEFAAAMRRSAAFLRGFEGSCFLGVSTSCLRRIRAPTQVLHHGLQGDGLHHLQDARAIAAAVPGSELVVEGDLARLERSLVDFARRVGAGPSTE